MARLDETIVDRQIDHLADHMKLAKKANYVFDVTDFDAVGDGATDDTAAIQAAVDASQDSGAGVTGGEILFPPGEYVISDSITLHAFSGILRGFGVGNSPVYETPSAVPAPGYSSVVAWHGDSSTPMFLLTDYRFVKFVDIRLEGSTDNPPTYAIESRSDTSYQGGSGAGLVVEDVHIGQFPWTTRGTYEGDVAIGIGFTGDNVNNDEFYFNRVDIAGCEVGFELLNSQSVWGSFANTSVNGASTAGVRIASALIGFNMVFNACQIDVEITANGNSNVYGWFSEGSGKILQVNNPYWSRVNVYGGWWQIQDTLGLGAGDNFISIAVGGSAPGGVTLQGVRIVNGVDADIYVRSYGATLATDTPGLLRLIDCSLESFDTTNIKVISAGGHNKTRVICNSKNLPELDYLCEGGILDTTYTLPTTATVSCTDLEPGGDIAHTGTNIGFYSATPAAKPEITGARDDGTALADLLTELATLGLITDSTTAS